VPSFPATVEAEQVHVLSLKVPLKEMGGFV
jgi:hypothetical protein